jgi:hypothetical protein
MRAKARATRTKLEPDEVLAIQRVSVRVVGGGSLPAGRIEPPSARWW